MLLKYQEKKKNCFYYLVAITSLIVNCLHGFLLQVGQQVKAKAQGAADTVKDALGAKK